MSATPVAIRFDLSALPAIRRAYQALLTVDADLTVTGQVSDSTRMLVRRAVQEVRST